MIILKKEGIGGLNSGSNLFVSSGAVNQPSLTYNAGFGTVTISEGKYRAFKTPDFTEMLYQFTVPETTLTIDENIESYLCVKYNDGNPLIYFETDKTLTNDSDIVVIYTCSRIGDLASGFSYLDWDEEGSSLPNKTNERLIDTRRFEREYGLEVSIDPNRIVTSTTGSVYMGCKRRFFPEAISNVDECFIRVKTPTGWDRSATPTYPNTQYDSGGSGLVDLTDGQYGVVWIYRDMGTNARIHFIMGRGSYTSVTNAKTAPQPSDVDNLMRLDTILVAQVIFLKGQNVPAEINSAFSTIFAPSVATVHNGLGGLQGGHPLEGEFYHASLEKYNVLNNTSGVNTGDETHDTIITKIGYTPEDVANKATTLSTSNDTLYPTVKATNDGLDTKEPTLTKGNLTAGSNKITIGGTGTNSVIGTGVSVDVNPTNILHNDLSTKQGGTTNEYYHLTSAQYTGLQTTLYTSTASQTITNTTTETTQIGSGIGTLTIPANRLVVGSKIRCRTKGYISTGINQPAAIKIKLGATTIFASSASALPNSLANDYVDLDFEFVIRSTGVSGTLIGEGRTVGSTSSGLATPFLRQLVMTTTATLNTTVSNIFDLTYQWSNASTSNSLTIEMFTLEITG